MEYKTLTEEQQDQIRANTIAQIEQEHFANTLARTRAEAAGNEAQIKSFDEILDSLDKQYAALTA